jgi:hypothetical protein
MPIANQSLGKDITFTVNTPTGPLTLNGKTDYDIKPMTTDVRHKDLDGNTVYGYIPDGWKITIRLDRQDPTVDNYFAQLEAAYYAGVNLQGGTILETIQEKDGSVTQFRYTNVVLKYDDAGNWKSDTLIPISLTAMATRRIKVA